ncbi:IGF-like family receptor 1 [Sorex araneus]|uniref:IGF-like family receptor 1 n=1 Tax=Sorex araneus TaxID=42254 RepID=UPI002433AFF2|nr:IGF-like family receptor 1 [Sorex araneus]
MSPRFLLKALLLLAGPASLESSQHCGRLEYWNPDNLCCGSCLQRFGPPPCSGYEFSENCGLNDLGDHVAHPFQECPPGQCNPYGAELCSPCGSGAVGPVPTESAGRTGSPRCREKPVPSKELCPFSSSSLPVTAGPVPSVPLPSFVLPMVLVLLPAGVVGLLFILQRHHLSRRKGVSYPCPGFACKDLDTPVTQYWSTPGSLDISEAGDSRKEVSPLTQLDGELPCLTSEPLSRLLDELEVLEELIVLLDPEPGPGGGIARGTTRHLASRYGLPAVWSNYAYSLRPSHSPLRALIEVVVAREPSASLGQLSTHLAQLGRRDALQVLSRLGRSGLVWPDTQN